MNDFAVIKIDEWYDIGNIDALKRTRSNIRGTIHVLDKEDENIFIFDEFVIKFFYNKKVCYDRVSRTENLKGLVPNLLGSTENFYKYEYVRGNLLAENINLMTFSNLLEWSKKNLWISKNDSQYEKNALSFYREKTTLRVEKFLGKYNLEDTEDYINGTIVPPVKKLLDKIDFHSIMGLGPTGFHGDFILDNILIDSGKFTLIDWRQDFNGSIDSGDMNYDLAKLNHNLILNHEILSNNYFSIDFERDITCDVYVKKSLLDCKNLLKDFCNSNNINYQSIEILSSIIWINMAPLHEHPLDMFLYYFGKYNLFLNLEKLNE